MVYLEFIAFPNPQSYAIKLQPNYWNVADGYFHLYSGGWIWSQMREEKDAGVRPPLKSLILTSLSLPLSRSLRGGRGLGRPGGSLSSPVWPPSTGRRLPGRRTQRRQILCSHLHWNGDHNKFQTGVYTDRTMAEDRGMGWNERVGEWILYDRGRSS